MRLDEGVAAPLMQPDLDDDSEPLPPVTREIGEESLHFKVIHASPSNMHTIRMPVASGRRLARKELAVSMHSLVDIAGGARCVSLQPVRHGHSSVLILDDLPHYDLALLMDTFTEWSPQKQDLRLK